MLDHLQGIAHAVPDPAHVHGVTVGALSRTAWRNRVLSDAFGCSAQCGEEKDTAFRRLALAVEGYCVHAGCRHRPAFYGLDLLESMDPTRYRGADAVVGNP
ncbi:DUF6420 family protein (plasmid) [Streptomyces sp. NBC_00111]|uniref:DUF6420 family protein n=1 Tax=unclassified Streptomyces TaxID=2593676 RepID=UPI002E353909|nr:DUF6420 family protein [Streptomyces sp. NBC_01460]